MKVDRSFGDSVRSDFGYGVGMDSGLFGDDDLTQRLSSRLDVSIVQCTKNCEVFVQQ